MWPKQVGKRTDSVEAAMKIIPNPCYGSGLFWYGLVSVCHKQHDSCSGLISQHSLWGRTIVGRNSRKPNMDLVTTFPKARRVVLVGSNRIESDRSNSRGPCLMSFSCYGEHRWRDEKVHLCAVVKCRWLPQVRRPYALSPWMLTVLCKTGLSFQ